MKREQDLKRRTFKGARVFDGERFLRRDLHTLDDRLVDRHPEGAAVDVVELGDAYVVPGLIEAHAHLVLSEDIVQDGPLTQRLLKGARNARRQLRAGVTTLRDVGGPGTLTIDLADSIARGEVEGPRVVACGTFLCSTGGHVHYWGIEADGRDGVRAAVRKIVKDGGRFIKVMASGGVAEPSEDPEVSQYAPEELAMICEEADRWGRTVAAHAHPARAINDCLRASVRTIEHASFLDDEGIDLALEHGAFIVPTFVVYAAMADDPKLPVEQRDLSRRVLDRKADSFLRAVERGVRWGVGTDAGSFMPPGRLWQEMDYIAALGIPATRVIDAATRTNAEILELSDVGRLDAGAFADLVVLEEDPLVRLEALREPRMVIQAGRIVSGSDPWLHRSDLARVGGKDA